MKCPLLDSSIGNGLKVQLDLASLNQSDKHMDDIKPMYAYMHHIIPKFRNKLDMHENIDMWQREIYVNYFFSF